MKLTRFLPLALSALFVATSALHAQVPNLINYQGRVVVGTTNFNSPPNGQFKFALVDGPGLVGLWSNSGVVAGPPAEPATFVSLPVTKGLYSVLLGDTTITNMAAIPSFVFTQPDLRLRVWFNDGTNGFQLLTPDQRLAPTGYLADGVVTASVIADQAITTPKIAAAAINASKLAVGAVNADALADGAINVSHLGVPAAPSTGQVLGYNGTDIAWIAPGGGGANGNYWAQNGASIYYSSGNVGIGTSTPATKLELRTGSGLYGLMHSDGTIKVASYVGSSASGATGGWLGTQSNHPLFLYTNGGQPQMTFATTGNVGIGTASPLAKLDVRGSESIQGLRVDASWDPTGISNVELTGAKPTLRWSAFDAGTLTTDSWIAHLASDKTLGYWTRRQRLFPSSDTNWVNKVNFTIDGDITYVGKLGKLDTLEQSNATVRATDLLLGHSARRGTPGRAMVDFVDAGKKVLVINFGNDWAETYIEGAVTRVRTLRILGGADLAEPFPMSQPDVTPGAVVVIDSEHPGKLRRSAAAYDKKVAGIVSGANGVQPGISMIQEDKLEAGENVALSGRVYVKANTSAGPIVPGDLLTTSDLPGEAMKAADHDRAQGAILGKAMTTLNEGTGMVLVLVTLQ